MIRAVLADVDGCVTGGEGQRLDLSALADLAAMNQRAQHDELTPAITLCTGRPAPYVELLQQAIGGRLPAIFEHGCGLYVPQPYGFRVNPAITLDLAAEFDACRARIQERLVRPGLAFQQPGKQHSATLYPIDLSVDELAARVTELTSDAMQLDRGVLCVNLVPAGVDKAAGAAWLARECGLALSEMAGIGDAEGDLGFLQVVGLAAAPANAVAAVRSRAALVSSLPSARGVVDLIGAIAERNRQEAAR